MVQPKYTFVLNEGLFPICLPRFWIVDEAFIFADVAINVVNSESNNWSFISVTGRYLCLIKGVRLDVLVF